MERYRPIHPERPAVRAAVAVALSLAVHGAALALLVAWALATLAAGRKAEAERPKEVALAMLDPEQWERNRSAMTFVPSAVENAAERAVPDRARFLSDQDRRAEQETVAKPVPGMPGRAGPPAVASLSQPGGGVPETPDDGVGPRIGAGPDLQPRPQPTKPLVMTFDVRGEGGVPELDGVAVGNLTVLNAEAWRYATFFDRVGETIYGVWRVEFLPRPPVPSVATRPKGGSVRVAFGVTFDAAGRAVEVTVRRSSGFADVDALLAELIRTSGPFPNFPPGLLDASGRYSDIWIIGLVWGWQR